MKTPHRVLFSQYPLTQIAAAFASGIILANYFAPSLAISIFIGAILSVTSLIVLVKGSQCLSGIFLLLAMICAGASVALVDKGSIDHRALKSLLANGEIGEGEQVLLTGTLAGPVEFASDRLYLTLKIETVEINHCEQTSGGEVSLLAFFQNPEAEQQYRSLGLRYLDRVRVQTVLRRSDQYRNPGVATLTEYLERKGFDATGQLKSPRMIAVLTHRESTSPLSCLYSARERLQTVIDAHFNPETAGVLDAAFLGNRYNLTKGVTERFRAGGTFHVLVISGLHISFIGGLVLLFVRRLTRNRLVQFALSSAVVWSYSLAVGAEPSVVRSALMFSFVTLAVVLFRAASSLNALGAAALILLVRNPSDLFDPSLQLTFLSVLAIVIFAWPLIQRLRAIGTWRPTRSSPYPPTCSRRLRAIAEALFWSQQGLKNELEQAPHKYRLPKTRASAWLERYRLQRPLCFVFCAITVSVSVQLMLLPFQVVYFHRISLSSFVLNIGVSALLAALAFITAVALLLAQLSSGLATPLFSLANGINWLMVHSVDPFSKLNLDSIRLPEYSGRLTTIYVLYYLPVLLFATALMRWNPFGWPASVRRRNRIVVLACLSQSVLIALVVLHPLSVKTTGGRLRVDFLDVGQGDAALVTMPDGTTLLIDAGGRPNFFRDPANKEGITSDREMRSVGETVVSEYLWWNGLDRVDYVLATHADADHIDGLNDVVRNFSVRSALVARTPASDPEFAKFAESLRLTATHLEVIGAGDVLHFGAVEAKVLSPVENADQNAPSGNDDSIVLRLQFGKRVILLTGDVEKKAETELLKFGELLAADVVKVPHHGSKTSSTEAFVRGTHPKLAIISVGLTSMFGHPHKEVVERWQRTAVQLLTTGHSGTISVTTDGADLTVKKFVE